MKRWIAQLKRTTNGMRDGENIGTWFSNPNSLWFRYATAERQTTLFCRTAEPQDIGQFVS